MEKPKYIIVAGINGAGKNTLYQTYPNLFKNTDRVNTDEILRKNHGNWHNQKDNILAGRETVKKIQYIKPIIENLNYTCHGHTQLPTVSCTAPGDHIAALFL